MPLSKCVWRTNKLFLTYAGTSDSEIFKRLPINEQNRINEIIEGERGNEDESPNYNQKGKPCQ